MTSAELLTHLRKSLGDPLPLPASGNTALRHSRLLAMGRHDLSYAKLAEAHWDAVAILAEAGRGPVAGAVYAVWASEKPDQRLRCTPADGGYLITGTKMFCTGATLVDRALLTTGEQMLVDVDLRANAALIHYDSSGWHTPAFAATQTATATFHSVFLPAENVVGEKDWYVQRSGFWHGACGPAACWAGGAAGLLDFAVRQRREDPHTLAHLGAMHAAVWMMEACLNEAGQEIDRGSEAATEGRMRALTVRHVVEQACSDILRRLLRAYGPHPLVFDPDISRRYAELDLFLRQCHAERDLEALGLAVRTGLPAAQ